MRALEVIESTRGHVKVWPGALHAPPLVLGDVALVRKVGVVGGWGGERFPGVKVLSFCTEIAKLRLQ